MIKKIDDNDFVSELHKKNPLHRIIRDHGVSLVLMTSGIYFKGYCPFCEEQPLSGSVNIKSKNSFVVNRVHNTFYCFKCKIGGDVLDFIRNFHLINITTNFRSKLYLSMKYGIKIEKELKND